MEDNHNLDSKLSENELRDLVLNNFKVEQRADNKLLSGINTDDGHGCVVFVLEELSAYAALVLAASLRKLKTKAKLIVIILCDLRKYGTIFQNGFLTLFDLVITLVNPDETAKRLKMEDDCAICLTLLAKIYCWSFTNYSKLLLLEVDCMAIQPIDSLFEPQIVTALAVEDGTYLQDSPLLLFPSQKIFNNIIKYIYNKNVFLPNNNMESHGSILEVYLSSQENKDVSVDQFPEDFFISVDMELEDIKLYENGAKIIRFQASKWIIKNRFDFGDSETVLDRVFKKLTEKIGLFMSHIITWINLFLTYVQPALLNNEDVQVIQI